MYVEEQWSLLSQTYTEGKMNLWNSNQGDMKRPSFLSTICILILNIEETLFKTVHWYFFKRFPSICRNTIEIVLRKDGRFMSPWLLFHKFNNSKYYSYTINYCLLYYITYTIMMVFCLFFLYEKVCFHAIRYFVLI